MPLPLRRRLVRSGTGAVLTILLGAGPWTSAAAAQSSAECASLDGCRSASLEAEAAGEGERFHDLAWRVRRFAPQDDPSVMYLIARAQAASGRSADALVMLRRLAEAGVATDAAELEVFERVRARDGWAEVVALASAASRRLTHEASSPAIATATPLPAPEAAPAPAAAASASAGAVPVVRSDGRAADAAVTSGAPGATTLPGRGAAAPAYGAALRSDVALRLEGALDGMAGGFAYDAVSGRYLVGDRAARKIVVVDEPSRRVADLVRGDSAGFRDLVAMEIDTRRGDLWVLSNDGATTGQEARATLHKLQLIAGRPLSRIEAPIDAGDVRFTDLAITADGRVLVVDAGGRRLYLVAPRGATLEPLMSFDLSSPTAIALADGDALAYVAHAGGVARIDLARRRVEPVRSAVTAAQAAIAGVWWHDGGLVVLRESAAGERSLERWQLDRPGTTVVGIRPVDITLPSAPTPVAITLSGSTLLVLAGGDEQAGEASSDGSGSGPRVVRRVRLGP